MQVDNQPHVVTETDGGQQDRFFPKGTPLAGWEWVTHALAWLSGLLIVALALLVTAEVVLRYFFKSPLGWSVEVSEYIVLFLTFLAAPWVLKYDQHVRVDVLVESLPNPARRVTRWVGNLIGLAACLILLYYSSVLFYESITTGAMVAKVFRVPRALLVGVIPVGSLLMAAYFLRAVLRGRFDMSAKTQAPSDHGGGGTP